MAPTKEDMQRERVYRARGRVIQKLRSKRRLAVEFTPAERAQLMPMEDEGQIVYRDGYWYMKEEN